MGGEGRPSFQTGPPSRNRPCL
uniref:Uncharacterized protein n=1 Tax=Anguilla anguilla TaxID=7936 RepID=A0A0E9PMT3_ANGAN